jgi:hypothetical protein
MRACLVDSARVAMERRFRQTTGRRRLVLETLIPAHRRLALQCYALKAHVKRAGTHVIRTYFAIHATRWAGG